jgi:hypothetical protein
MGNMLTASIFQDNVYESMDWLEKACLPMISTYHETYPLLPDKVPFNKEDLLLSYSKSTELKFYMSLLPYQENIDKILNTLNYCLSFSTYDFYEASFIGNVKWDFDSQEIVTLEGSFELIKKPMISEKELLLMLQERFTNMGAWVLESPKVKKLLALLGVPFPSHKKDIINIFHKFIKELFTNNIWQIYNIDLFIMLAEWISRLLNDPNDLHAKRNLLQLKCMVLNNKPIYSMKVEK